MTTQTTDPSSSGTTQTTQSSPTATDPAAQWDAFVGSLDEATQTHVKSSGYKDFASLARADMAARQLIGADKASVLRLPKQTREENPGAWRDVDKALGVPEDGKYAEFKPAKGELRASAEQLSKFDAAMAKAGAGAAQRNAALAAFHEINTEVVTALNAEKAQAVTELQGKWGVKYQAKVQAADSALNGIDGADDFNALMDRFGLADHPHVTQVLAALAEARGEDGATPVNKGAATTKITNGVAQMTPQDAQARLAQLEGDKAFMDRYLNGEPAAIEEYLALANAIAA